MTTNTPATHHTTSTTSTEFETLMASFVDTYRPPTGSLVHPETLVVPNPHRDPVAAQKAKRQATISTVVHVVGFLSTMVIGFAIMIFGSDVVFRLLDTAGHHNLGIALASLTVLVSMPGTVVVGGNIIRHDDATNGKRRGRDELPIPSDVGAAYQALCDAPAQLRKAAASEEVVAEVESRVPYAEELLVEAARLHTLDASATEDAIAVRNQMVDMAAMAQSLVVLAQRHQAVIVDAEMTTPMLLSRAPDNRSLHVAGELLEADTAFVRSVLNPDAAILGTVPVELEAI